MRTADDPRHKKRQEIIQGLFKVAFHEQPAIAEVKKIMEHQAFLDKQIQIAAPEFPTDKINKIDLAILRLAMYELFIEKNTPVNVIIDEAIELAKEFAGPSDPAFINGALANIIKHENVSSLS